MAKWYCQGDQHADTLPCKNCAPERRAPLERACLRMCTSLWVWLADAFLMEMRAASTTEARRQLVVKRMENRKAAASSKTDLAQGRQEYSAMYTAVRARTPSAALLLVLAPACPTHRARAARLAHQPADTPAHCPAVVLRHGASQSSGLLEAAEQESGWQGETGAARTVALIRGS